MKCDARVLNEAMSEFENYVIPSVLYILFENFPLPAIFFFKKKT